MELFCVPFERDHSETKGSTQNNAISCPNPDDMSCTIGTASESVDLTLCAKPRPLSTETTVGSPTLSTIPQYAWDGNAFPGNEYWLGMLTASGDPAAACCSNMPELQGGNSIGFLGPKNGPNIGPRTGHR